MRRTLLVVLSFFALLTLNFALAGAVSAHTDVLHVMKVRDAKQSHHNGRSVLLSSHGGPIEKTPVVFVVFWGPDWASGFATGGYTSGQGRHTSRASSGASAAARGPTRRRSTARTCRRARPLARQGRTM